MGEKVLVLMPIFMGYDKAFREANKDKFKITIADNEKNIVYINNYLKSNICCKILRKLKSSLYKYFIIRAQNMFSYIIDDEICKEYPDYDLIICINGHCLSRNLIKKMRNSNPNSKIILYLWDDITNLMHIPFFDLYDECYSFNIKDCNDYDLKYLPMFVAGTERNHNKNLYDICIIGTGHPDRVEFINKLYNKYRDKYSFFIYIYSQTDRESGFIKNQPMEYDDYLSVLSCSRCVVDIPYIKQNGPTTRFFDALLTSTKVITVNKDIINYPVFSENVCIINRNDPVLCDDFIRKEYKTISYTPLNVNQWMEVICSEQ